MTIEPPFYACLSKECLTQDYANIDKLGPLAFALDIILLNAEKNRQNTLKLTNDNVTHCGLGSF